MDRQLKVRGFRVEPGEIESVLAGHPDIDQVSVVASTRSSGDTRLVAYYTPSAAAADAGAGTHHPSAASFRSYLLDRLPGYMIPAAFIARHRLPTPPERDGSPPTRRLPTRHRPARPTQPRPTQPDRPSPTRRPAPRQRVPKQRERLTPTQAGLAALWARLLHREHVGLDDDFFALGGNSLLAAEMLAGTRASFRIPSDSVRPLTRCLLRDPTLRGSRPRFGTPARAAWAPTAISRRSTSPPRPRLTSASGATASRPGRGRTGDTRARSCSPARPGSSAPTCCGNCSPPPTRASGAWSEREDEADARHRIAQAAARYELPAPPEGRVVAASRRPRQARARAVRRTVPRPRAHRRHHLPPGRAGELHLPVPGAAGRQRGGHPRGDPAGGGVPRHSGALRVDHRGAGRPRRRGHSRGHRGDAAPLPRAAADGLRRDEVRRRRATAERGPRRPSGRYLPAAGHRRQHRHRCLEHLDRDVRADQVHDRHRAGARHRPAA